jgi:hypothetical protein
MYIPNIGLMLLLTHPEAMARAVDDFILSLGLEPGPTEAYG